MPDNHDIRALLATHFDSAARCLDCGDLYDRWRLSNGVCPACAELDEALCTILPCGCYSDACYCGQYPSELDVPPAAAMLPTTEADWVFAERLRNRFDLRSDGGLFNV